MSEDSTKVNGDEEVGQCTGEHKENGADNSPEIAVRNFKPVSRNHSLKYSGGALHGLHQPTSFDHNFDSISPSAPQRPIRRRGEDVVRKDESVTRRGGQLPPLVRVRADLAAETGAGDR